MEPMLSPYAKPANRFRATVQRRLAQCMGGLSVLGLPLAGIVAPVDSPLTDGSHKVGLADSRVGYEAMSYVTD